MTSPAATRSPPASGRNRWRVAAATALALSLIGGATWWDGREPIDLRTEDERGADRESRTDRSEADDDRAGGGRGALRGTRQGATDATAPPPDSVAATTDHPQGGSSGPSGLPPSSPSPTGPSSASAVIDRPAVVRIPAIGVDAPVVALGLDDDGALEVPSDFGDAGWYADGPEPGDAGAAVLAGHVDSRTGPAVFYRLDELTAGDRVEVAGEDGAILTFRVQRVERYPKDEFPTEAVYGSDGNPTLRLITCGGRFDRSSGSYDDNIVVFAVEPQPGAAAG